MKSSGLIVAAIVLLALTGTLYWSDHHKAKEDTASASTSTSPKILNLSQSDITGVVVKKNGAEELALAKDSGKWTMTAPKPWGVDQDAATSMVSSLSGLDAERVVDDKVTDVSQYGLANPAAEIDVTAKDNKTKRLLIGDETPTGNGSFAMVAGDPRVFTIASYNKTSIDKSANDLRDKRLLTADFDKVSQIELQAKKQDIEFGRTKDAWQIVKPKELRADNFEVEDLARKLKDAKMDLAASADEKKTAAAFAAGTPVATAKVTDASGTQELQIRKNKDDYYAKSSVAPGIYKVASDVGQGLDKGLDDFRNKKLFDFGYDDPNKVEIKDNGKAYFLTKGGADWWSADGKKLDEMNAEAVVEKVRELSASKFVDAGFGAPAMEITVTSNDNKRVEKALISKNGNHYIAKRENEPSLYELDAALVDGLQKATADLKPAAPAAPPSSAPAATKK